MISCIYKLFRDWATESPILPHGGRVSPPPPFSPSVRPWKTAPTPNRATCESRSNAQNGRTKSGRNWNSINSKILVRRAIATSFRRKPKRINQTVAAITFRGRRGTTRTAHGNDRDSDTTICRKYRVWHWKRDTRYVTCARNPFHFPTLANSRCERKRGRLSSMAPYLLPNTRPPAGRARPCAIVR